MKSIVLDLGVSQIYLSGRFYRYNTDGNTVVVQCKGSEKKWIYDFTSFSISDKEIRFFVEKNQKFS